MDSFTVMVVSDERSPVRRFQVPRVLVRRAVWGGVAIAFLASLLAWDYWRLRMENAELDGLRLEAAEQREQIEGFHVTLRAAETRLNRVRELERKVRIIANLPGASAVGGDQVTELAPQPTHPGEDVPELPVGVPVDAVEALQGQGGPEEEPDLALPPPDPVAGVTTEGAREVAALGDKAAALRSVAEVRGDSLDLLLAQLEDKSDRLASMPSIWPARGWLTSRYGPRISPFTGRRHTHSGIDVAAREGTPIVAPARARVAFVGSKGPLGKTIVLDHGHGVRTVYGHTSKIHVSTGDLVERGGRIADIGTTGRSTGPHLHYTVQVNGRSRDPLDYIFD